jgi:hypothetical protein
VDAAFTGSSEGVCRPIQHCGRLAAGQESLGYAYHAHIDGLWDQALHVAQVSLGPMRSVRLGMGWNWYIYSKEGWPVHRELS